MWFLFEGGFDLYTYPETTISNPCLEEPPIVFIYSFFILIYFHFKGQDVKRMTIFLLLLKKATKNCLLGILANAWTIITVYNAWMQSGFILFLAMRTIKFEKFTFYTIFLVLGIIDFEYLWQPIFYNILISGLFVYWLVS